MSVARVEPLQSTFERISIRSGYRSPKVNERCNEEKLSCANNQKNAAHHIWDSKDVQGHKGAMACIVVNGYVEHYEQTGDWQALAWWIHDHLPYASLCFFPKLCAFNIGWHEQPTKEIYSYIDPKGHLTKPGMENHDGNHRQWYGSLNLLQSFRS